MPACCAQEKTSSIGRGLLEYLTEKARRCTQFVGDSVIRVYSCEQEQVRIILGHIHTKNILTVLSVLSLKIRAVSRNSNVFFTFGFF